MTLNKKMIVQSVMEKVRFKRQRKAPQKLLFPELGDETLSRERASEIVEALFEIIKKTLAGGEDLTISGFGKFQVKFQWARGGRNPQTGEPIILGPKRRVGFRASRPLREKMNAPRPPLSSR